MKKIYMFIFIFILLFRASFSYENYQKIILKSVNIERKKYNLKPLKMDNCLNNIAITKAKDMAKEKKMSHTSKKFGSTFNLMRKNRKSFSKAGENIACGHKTPEFVVERWLKSKEHRKNILEKNYRYIGIGKASDSSGKIYWVQVFKD